MPAVVFGSQIGTAAKPDMTGSVLGILALVIFVLAYILVMAEEFLHLRKSKPVILAAGIIWVLVAILAQQNHVDTALLETAVQHNLVEYSALFLFLLVAMTYINAMTERNVFEVLRAWLIKKQFSYRQLFWITGIIAFFLSPIADNLGCCVSDHRQYSCNVCGTHDESGYGSLPVDVNYTYNRRWREYVVHRFRCRCCSYGSGTRYIYFLQSSEWTWAIALGYAASIYAHYLISQI